MKKVFWPMLAVVFFVLLVLSLSLHAWNLRLWPGTVDHDRFGDWSSAVSGLATTTAVVVAFLAILAENRRARAAEQAIEQRSRTQVYCWLEPREADGVREWLLVFENLTGMPVLVWSVDLVDENLTISSRNLGPIRPKHSEISLAELGERHHANVPNIRLTFVDAAGNRWTRSEAGFLAKDK